MILALVCPDDEGAHSSLSLSRHAVVFNGNPLPMTGSVIQNIGMSITGTIIRLGVLLLAFAASQWMPYEYASYMVIAAAIGAVAATFVLSEQRTVEFATVGGMIGGIIAALFMYFGRDYGEDVITYVFYSITGCAGVIVGGTTGLAIGVLTYVAVEIVRDPMRSVRDFVAIVVAIVAGMIFHMAVLGINMQWYPLPDGVDMNNVERFGEYIQSLPWQAFLMVLLAHLGGSFVSGLAVSAVAGRVWYPIAAALGIFWLVGGVMNDFSAPHPGWFRLVDIALYIPAAVLGTRVYELITGPKADVAKAVVPA